MTFDEVLDEMSADQEPSESIRFMERLRDIYAPPIKMTPNQYEVFKKYRYGKTRGDMEFGGIWPPIPYRIMDYFKEYGYYGPIPDNMLAQAWLHPETIKVID